jgi:hypothetical protein
MREWCWLLTVRDTLRSAAVALWRGAPVTAMTFAPVSSHDYVATEDWDVLARVQVAKCARCGKYSVGWYSEHPVGKPPSADAVDPSAGIQESRPRA